MISKLFDRLFIVYWLCWLVVRLTRAYGAEIPLVNNWLADIVFIPIIVHTSLVISNALLKITRGYPLTSILIICCIVSVVYEAILPALAFPTRADWWDVAAYFTGGLFYYLIHQPLALRGWSASDEKKVQAFMPNKSTS